jgi:hypothetical protein
MTEELDPCRGCTLHVGSLLCQNYNDGSCPCTECIVKMMRCDNLVVNDSCDKWRNWFNKKYECISGSKWDD